MGTTAASLRASPGSNMESVLAEALAGAPGPRHRACCRGRGNRYPFDLAEPEAQRLRRIRERQGGSSIDTALDLYAMAQARSADGITRSAAEPLFERVDAALGDALLSLSYAVDLGDSQGTALSSPTSHAATIWIHRKSR